MLFLKTKLFKISLIFLLSMCIGCAIICTPSFADDSETISADDDLIIREASKVIADSVYSTSDVRATDYAQQIYNYLVNTIHQDLSTMNGYNSSMNTRLLNIQNSLNGGSTNNTSLYSLISNLNTMITGSTTSGVSIRDLDLLICDFMFGGTASYPSGFLWSSLQSIQAASTASSTYSYQNGVKLDTTNTNLSNILNSINNSNIINWDSSGFNYKGVSLNYDTTFLTSAVSSKSFKVVFTATSTPYDQPCLVRLYVPFLINNSNDITTNFTLANIKKYTNNTFSNLTYDIDYFIEHANNGTYFYIYNFWKRGNVDYYFEITCPSNMWYYSSYYPTIDFISFNDSNYQIIRTAFYNVKSSKTLDHIDSDLHSISSDLNKITQEIASDDIRQAKQASQAVIDDTLDGFTGNGSASAKVSDTSSMKSVSGDIRSGLAGGGSVGNATSVFNNNSNFWDWFTQTTSDNINNPYPAPVVEQTRGYGDEILDFLTPNTQEVQDLLNSESEER